MEWECHLQLIIGNKQTILFYTGVLNPWCRTMGGALKIEQKKNGSQTNGQAIRLNAFFFTQLR